MDKFDQFVLANEHNPISGQKLRKMIIDDPEDLKKVDWSSLVPESGDNAQAEDKESKGDEGYLENATVEDEL